MHRATEQDFRRTLQALREECPTSMGHPVRVRRTSRVGPSFGWSKLRRHEDVFLIVLRTRIHDFATGRVRNVTRDELRDTLLHEWAHVMSWTPVHPSLADHDATWGVNYSKTYQATTMD